LRVLRIYHGGRNADHRMREQALVAVGAEVTLVVPTEWPEGGTALIPDEAFDVLELNVRRAGNVNRHVYRYGPRLDRLIEEIDPDVIDIHEEPYSLATRQWLSAASPQTPTVLYTAQNIDKRLPPPYVAYERRAYRRATALYPCSRQAASVARGKGFTGRIEVIPLGFDPSVYTPGAQSVTGTEIVLGFFGRLVPEKGPLDVIKILARLHAHRPTRLLMVGEGPERASALRLADELGVQTQLESDAWQSADALASLYRRCHFVLVPSKATAAWAEQFGRVIVEAQASGAVVAGYSSGAIPEVAGSAGLLVHEGDYEGLADAIAGLAERAATYADRRASGLAQSTARTWAAVAAQQMELYEYSVKAGTPHRSGRVKTARASARAEFGPTAHTPIGPRPVAVPRVPVFRAIRAAVNRFGRTPSARSPRS
jgi:glycosyltransferase involved in cell wall biosynthesis